SAPGVALCFRLRPDVPAGVAALVETSGWRTGAEIMMSRTASKAHALDAVFRLCFSRASLARASDASRYPPLPSKQHGRGKRRKIIDTKRPLEFGCFSGWLAAVLVVLGTARTYAQSPWAATQAAGPVGPAAATFHGMATARGAPTAAWFERGTDTSYGSVTTPTDIGSSSKVVRVSAAVDGLSPGATYHYRLVATNALGTASGADMVFTTGMKVSTWTDQSVPSPK